MTISELRSWNWFCACLRCAHVCQRPIETEREKELERSPVDGGRRQDPANIMCVCVCEKEREQAISHFIQHLAWHV